MLEINITHVTVHTDGACLGNPGPGGWSAIIRWWDEGAMVREEELTDGAAVTTNNRMELAAAIAGIRRIIADNPAPSLPITVYSDSEYVTLNATERLPKWLLNGWRTSDRKPVKNMDLWSDLHGICNGRRVAWRWLRGHDGNEMNERADALANLAAARYAPANL